LLLLIDGTRSVRELATATHSTDFEVARVVYGLFSAGLLEVPSDEEIERLRSDRSRREDKRATLDAARAAREGEQTAEAPGLEAQLAAEAEARIASGQPPAVIEPEPVAAEVSEPEPEQVAAESAEPRHVPEEPEFLSGSGEAPSPDDMAVFEQMMQSVLTPQISDESEQEVAGAGAEFVPGLDFMPGEPEIAGLQPEPAGELEDETPFVPYAPSVEEGVPAEAPGDDFGFGALSGADMEGIPAPPVVEAEPVAAGLETSGDFETDLRSLGLGEYPEELLQPEAPTEARLPMSEMEAGLTGEVPAEFPAEAADGADLDSLLASLGSETPAEGVISSGIDYGDDADSSGGVLSTDSFLAEFDTGSGLSDGLGDELTALTGGASGRSRPVATVNKIPEAGEGHHLQRDQLVDKTLLEKIIEGIENL
jgi:hypothetical protein